MMEMAKIYDKLSSKITIESVVPHVLLDSDTHVKLCDSIFLELWQVRAHLTLSAQHIKMSLCFNPNLPQNMCKMGKNKDWLLQPKLRTAKMCK